LTLQQTLTADFSKWLLYYLSELCKTRPLATKAKFDLSDCFGFLFLPIDISIVVVGRAATKGVFHNGAAGPNWFRDQELRREIYRQLTVEKERSSGKFAFVKCHLFRVC
jgi:hypothetical protein